MANRRIWRIWRTWSWRGVDGLRLGVLLAGVLLAGALQAQVPGTNPNDPNATTLQEDSLAQATRDSLQAILDSVPIPRITVRMQQAWLPFALEHTDSIKTTLGRFHLWNEIDTLPGFAFDLGQVGKPYRQYMFGLPEHLRNTQQWINPLTGQADIYVLNAQSQAEYLDTRTPFVEIEFQQNRRDMQLLRVQVAHNITPYWNLHAYYKRRTAEGAYLNNSTDQLVAALTQRIHTPNKRYHGLLTLSYQELLDELNGGTLAGPEEPRDNRFDKGAEPTVFAADQVQFERFLRSIYTQHSYYLVNDSSFRAGLQAGATLESFMRFYEDASPARSLANGAYPQWFNPDTTRLVEQTVTTRSSAYGGALIHLQTPVLKWWNRGTLGLQRTTTDGVIVLPEDAWTEQQARVQSRLEFGGDGLLVRATADLKQVSSNLMPAELDLTASGWLGFGYREVTYRDSSILDTSGRRPSLWITEPYTFDAYYAPIALMGRFRVADLNPSLFHRYWTGATFEGLPGAQNQAVREYAIGVRVQGQPGADLGLAFLPNFWQVEGGLSEWGSPLYFTDSAQLAQAENTTVRTPYLTSSGRFRVWRFYAEAQVTVQDQLAADDSPAALTGYLPQVFGQADVFFRHMLFDRKLEARSGFTLSYRSAFTPYQFDPSIQQFYPQFVEDAVAYPVFGAYASGRIRSVQFFFKVLHLNEAFTQPGYYSVLGYPMQERAFCFGVNWRLYD